MNAKKPSRRVRQLKATAVRKAAPKAQPGHYVREPLSGSRLIRADIPSSLAKAPVLG